MYEMSFWCTKQCQTTEAFWITEVSGFTLIANKLQNNVLGIHMYFKNTPNDKGFRLLYLKVILVGI